MNHLISLLGDKQWYDEDDYWCNYNLATIYVIITCVFVLVSFHYQTQAQSNTKCSGYISSFWSNFMTLTQVMWFQLLVIFKRNIFTFPQEWSSSPSLITLVVVLALWNKQLCKQWSEPVFSPMTLCNGIHLLKFTKTAHFYSKKNTV